MTPHCASPFHNVGLIRRDVLAATALFRVDHAGATVPAHLGNFAGLDQHGYAALSTGQIPQTLLGCRVRIHVLLNKVTPLPFKPLTHLLRMGHLVVP